MSVRSHPAATLALLAIVAVAGCGGGTEPVRTPVESIAVGPPSATIVAGATQAFTATLRDGAGQPVTGRSVFWASRDPTIASVRGDGTVTGLLPGTTQIAASIDGKSSVANVTIAPKPVISVRITPSDSRIFTGQTTQLRADPLDAGGEILGGRTITWAVGNTSVATVSTGGILRAVAQGATTITATVEGKVGVATVTVSVVPVKSVAVTPPTGDIVVAQTLQLTAAPRDSAGGALAGRVVTWRSSNDAIATVSSSGLVVAFAAGNATITATSEGVNGTAAVRVRNTPVSAVVVNPAATTLAIGQTLQLTSQVTDANGNILTGRTITYASSTPAIATVTAGGLVTAVAQGTATITASSEGKTGTATIQVVPVPVATVNVQPTTATVVAGSTQALTAQTLSASGAVLAGRTVAWTSGAPSVASVSSSGVVTGVAPGVALIFAVSEGKTGVSTITVVRPTVANVTIAPTTASISIAGSVSLRATATDANGNAVTGSAPSWSSSNSLIAVVSSQGNVVGLLPGTVTITATIDGVSGTATITVK
jgi:uncharacterized protein YjdB